MQDPLPLEDSRPSHAAWMWWLVEFLGSLWATIWVVELGIVLILAPHILVFLLPRWGRLAVSPENPIRWTLAVLWVLLDLPFLWRLWTSQSEHRDHPIPLYVAARQPLLHPILRPVVAAWWLAHFAAAVALGISMERIAPMDLPILSLFLFWCAFMSNIFLIHAVTALTRGPAVQRVWNSRGVLDLGLVIVGLVWTWAAHQSRGRGH